MKTKKIRILYFSFLLLSLGMFSNILVSCDSNDDTQTSKSQQANTKLESFYDTHNDLMNSLLKAKTESEKDSIEDIMKSNFSSILSQCYTQSRSTSINNNSNTLLEDSIEILSLNPKLLLSYIKPKVTQEFYSICNNLISSPYSTTMSEEDIINDNNLKTTEKVALLTYLPASQKNITSKRLKTRSEESFLTPYQQACAVCAAALVLKSAAIAALAETGPLAAAELAIAVAEYEACISEAAEKYHVNL
jgi:hypothetical protein